MQKISGVYQITFSTGEFYIGKTIDFDRRKQEHTKKLRAGTAAKAMQDAANRGNGIMNIKLIYMCHPDHIDILEDIFIAEFKRIYGSKCLNTTQRASVSTQDIDILLKNSDLLQLSTADHLRLINNR